MKKKKKKFILITLGICVCVLLILLLATPSILSSNYAKSIILKKLNKTIKCEKIEIKDITLSWFNNQSIKAIHIYGAQGKYKLYIKEIIIEKTLLGLLSGNNLGTTIVDSCLLNVYLDSKSIKDTNKTNNKTKKLSNKTKDEKGSKKSKVSSRNYEGFFIVKNGQINIHKKDKTYKEFSYSFNGSYSKKEDKDCKFSFKDIIVNKDFKLSNLDIALSGNKIKNLKLNLKSSQFAYKEFSIKNLGINIKGKDTLVDIALKGIIDSTEFAIYPKIDLSKKPAIITLPQTDITFKKTEMINKLLLTFAPKIKKDLKIKGITALKINKLKMPLSKDWKKSIILDLDLNLDQITVHKVKIDSPKLNINWENSLILSSLNGILNKGILKIKPKINLKGKTPILTIPKNSIILSKAHIDSNLLSKLCPVFNDAVKTEGLISLKMQSFSAPLTKDLKEKMKFILNATPKNIKFEANQEITNILSFLKMKNQLTLKEQDWEFICKDGFIESKGMTVKTIKNYEFTITGKVGFDKSLSYQFNFPFKDKTITAKITGTIDKPNYNYTQFLKDNQDILIEKGVETLIDIINNKKERKKLLNKSKELLNSFFK